MPLHHRVAVILSSSPQLEEPEEIASDTGANVGTEDDPDR